MFKVNNDLTNGHAFASRPTHWPLMLKGVAYWLDKDTNVKCPLLTKRSSDVFIRGYYRG